MKNVSRIALFTLCGTLLAISSGCQNFGKRSLDANGNPIDTSKRSLSFNPANYSKLAVIVENAELQNGPDLAPSIEGLVTGELLERGYQVASRSDVSVALREMRFQESGLTEAQASQIGRMLNVPGVVIVRVLRASSRERRTDSGSSYSYSVAVQSRLINVASAVIEWQDRAEDSTGFMFDGRDLGTIADAATVESMRAFPALR